MEQHWGPPLWSTHTGRSGTIIILYKINSISIHVSLIAQVSISFDSTSYIITGIHQIILYRSGTDYVGESDSASVCMIQFPI